MQWLFNIIRNLVSQDVGFVDRGDPTGYDFSTRDFTADNNWRDLNLGSIVPEHAVAVLLRVRVMTTSGYRLIRFRKNGNVNVGNLANVATVDAGFMIWEDIVVACDVNRMIEYRAIVAEWTYLDVTVGGWWLHRTVF